MSTIITIQGTDVVSTSRTDINTNFSNLNTDKYESGDSPTFGNITVTGTVDGRDVATDGTKLDGIEALAEVNNISDVNATDLTDAGDSTLHFHSADRARANHTGTQLASTISDFDTEVSNNASVTANTAKVTNANHTGDATGDTALTLATVNSNVGSFTNADVTVNAKGLVTAVSNGTGGHEIQEDDVGVTARAGLNFLGTQFDVTDDAGNDATDITLSSATTTSLGLADTALQDVVNDTTPQLGGQLDVNGQSIGDGIRELVTFTEDASAVNHVNIENEATGAGPTIRSVGDDASVDLNFDAKGSGDINLNVDTTGEVVIGGTNAALNVGGRLQVGTDVKMASGQGWIDGNDNEVLTVVQTASAVNELNLANAATGNGPEIQAAGNDTNIDIELIPKGTGSVVSEGTLKIAEQADAEADTAGYGQIWVDTATPNKLMFTDDAGSDFIMNDTTDNLRFIDFIVVEPGTDVATGTDKVSWTAPFAGTIVQDDTDVDYFAAYTQTAGTTGTMVVDIHKGTTPGSSNGTTIMTTNKLDIETTEVDTTTAATQPDLTTTTFSKGDIFTIDIDAVHTTAAKGLVVRMAVRPD